MTNFSYTEKRTELEFASGIYNDFCWKQASNVIFVFAYVPLHMLFKIPTSFLQSVMVFFIMGDVHELGPVLLSKEC